MQPTLLVHILAGAVGLLTGYVALYAAKGQRVHRRSGLLFVYAMTVMGLTGAGIAAFEGVEVSVVAGLTSAYLVVTSLTTVRPPTPATRRLDLAAMVVAFGVGGFAVVLGVATVTSPTGMRDGLPGFPFFILGLPAFLGSFGDLRRLRMGLSQGRPRLVRHLWRMTYALLIAALSFFLGQADEFPQALRHPALLAAPILAVLFSLLYWLWRMRRRRAQRGTAGVAAPFLT